LHRENVDPPYAWSNVAVGLAGLGDEMTASTCRSCGTQLRPSAKFCDECGTPTATTATAEYKQVTVLFADVVRSMELAAAVDPERLRDIITELFSRSTDVVCHYGGTVDKFTGDGVMALFGAPPPWKTTQFVRAWRRWIFTARPGSWPRRSNAATASL
jgi:class 3 adenylate cyclase